MSSYYGGVPIEDVDFEKEFNKELAILEESIKTIKSSGKVNYRYWAIKLNRANKQLEVGRVTLDVT